MCPSPPWKNSLEEIHERKACRVDLTAIAGGAGRGCRGAGRNPFEVTGTVFKLGGNPDRSVQVIGSVDEKELLVTLGSGRIVGTVDNAAAAVSGSDSPALGRIEYRLGEKAVSLRRIQVGSTACQGDRIGGKDAKTGRYVGLGLKGRRHLAALAVRRLEERHETVEPVAIDIDRFIARNLLGACQAEESELQRVHRQPPEAGSDTEGLADPHELCGAVYCRTVAAGVPQRWIVAGTGTGRPRGIGSILYRVLYAEYHLT